VKLGKKGSFAGLIIFFVLIYLSIALLIAYGLLSRYSLTFLLSIPLVVKLINMSSEQTTGCSSISTGNMLEWYTLFADWGSLPASFRRRRGADAGVRKYVEERDEETTKVRRRRQLGIRSRIKA